MRYIVAYTLKHNETPDTFKDEYMVFGEDDNIKSGGLEKATRYYHNVLSENDIEDGWHVFTASICRVIMSTDY